MRARHLEPDRYRLDGQVAESLGDRSQTWGLGQAAIAVLAIVAVFFAIVLLGRSTHLSAVLADPLFDAAQVGLVVIVARPAIRQAGSLSAAFGFGAPRWRDAGLVIGWFLIGLVATRIIPALLVSVIPPLRRHDVSSVPVPVHVPVGVAAVVITETLLFAPVIEELLFRGLLLRAAMRRFPFLPSAVGSSLIFGAFHAWPVLSWQGAIIVVLTKAGFGFVQCLLVRRTGRLGPAIAMHALTNAAAIAAVVILA